MFVRIGWVVPALLSGAMVGAQARDVEVQHHRVRVDPTAGLSREEVVAEERELRAQGAFTHVGELAEAPVVGDEPGPARTRADVLAELRQWQAQTGGGRVGEFAHPDNGPLR